MEQAAVTLIAALQRDPTSSQATKNYRLALLCHGECTPKVAPSKTRADLILGNRFCDDLCSHGVVEDGDLLRDSWLKQSEQADEQARRLSQVAKFQQSLFTDQLNENGDLKRSSTCENCAAAVDSLFHNRADNEMPKLQLPRAWRGLRKLNLSALTRSVTVHDVRKALNHISRHGSLSVDMRLQASRSLEQECVIANFATAIDAMLNTTGRLWQWGDGVRAPPHHHAVHGLKKCRAFCEPQSVLMMTFLEVLCDRLFPEAAKSLNPLQRWRHKHEVWGNTDAVRNAIMKLQRREQRSEAPAVDTPTTCPDVDMVNPFDQAAEHMRQNATLKSRLEQMQRMRLRLRQRFEFPLSHGFCYDGGSDAFAKLFAGLHAEIQFCSLVHSGHGLKETRADASDRPCSRCNLGKNPEIASHDSSELSDDFEVIEEELAVVRTDIQSFCDTVPHELILHCLRSLGLGEEWLAFFKRYMELPLPSGGAKNCGLPLGPSLSTLLLEIVGCFLDTWLHNCLSRATRASCLDLIGSKRSQAHSAFGSPLRALLRCGDDAWLLSRVSDAPRIWRQVFELYSSCGLTLNMNESGSMIVSDSASKHPPVKELAAPPCWSLLELTPKGTWTVSKERLSPRLERATAELEVESRPLLERIHLYNRYVDSLLRQGGFHEDLRQGLLPLHGSMQVLFEKAVSDYLASSKADPLPFEKAPGSSLAPLLWWPKKSGGLGARHHLLALHEADYCLSAKISEELRIDSFSLETSFQRMAETLSSRNDSYETSLRKVFGPLILELFGTHTVLDERYTSLLS